MCVEPARNPGKECANYEGGYFITSGVNSDGRRGNLIIMHGQKSAPISGMDEHQDGENGDCSRAIGPKQIGIRRYSLQTAGTADRLDVLKYDPDNFAKPQGDNRQVISFEPQGGDSDQPTNDGRQKAACAQCSQEKQWHAGNFFRAAESGQNERAQKECDCGG